MKSPRHVQVPRHVVIYVNPALKGQYPEISLLLQSYQVHFLFSTLSLDRKRSLRNHERVHFSTRLVSALSMADSAYLQRLLQSLPAPTEVATRAHWVLVQRHGGRRTLKW